MQRATYATETTIAYGVTLLLCAAALVDVLNEHDFSTAVPGMVVVKQGSTTHTTIWLVALTALVAALTFLYALVYDENNRECAASRRPVACQAQRNNKRSVAFLLLGVLASDIFALLALLHVVEPHYFLLVLAALAWPFVVVHFSSTVSYAPLPRLPPPF